MIPMKTFSLEHQHSHNRKHRKRDYFLYDFQLKKGKRSAITDKANFVTRYLETVFKKCDTPREQNYSYQRPTVRDLHFAEFKMSVPRQRHEHIRADEKQYRIDCVHLLFFLLIYNIVRARGNLQTLTIFLHERVDMAHALWLKNLVNRDKDS